MKRMRCKNYLELVFVKVSYPFTRRANAFAERLINEAIREGADVRKFQALLTRMSKSYRNVQRINKLPLW